jgi:hypothetical protein
MDKIEPSSIPCVGYLKLKNSVPQFLEKQEFEHHLHERFPIQGCSRGDSATCEKIGLPFDDI